MTHKKFTVAGLCFLCIVGAYANTHSQQNTATNHPGSSTATSRHFQIGRFIDQKYLIKGYKVLTLQPTMRQQASLLLQHENIKKTIDKYNTAPLAYPFITLSGKLAGMLQYYAPHNKEAYTKEKFDTQELDAYIQPASSLSTYVAVEYDPERQTDKLYVDRAFLIIGDLSVSPFYVSLGKMYAPFGNYASDTISGPVTKSFARTLSNIFVLGYQQPQNIGMYGGLYLYQGKALFASDKQKGHIESGVDAGFTFQNKKMSGKIGGGLITNLADSEGMQQYFNTPTPSGLLVHRVPAIDIYTSIGYKRIKLLAEFVSALKTFSPTNLAYHDHGAKPSAFSAEIAFNMISFNRPSGLAVGYNQTFENPRLWKKSYQATYNINVVKDSYLAFEYLHRIYNKVNSGYDLVTVEFYYYF